MVNDMVLVTQRSETTSLNDVPVTGSRPSAVPPRDSQLPVATSTAAIPAAEPLAVGFSGSDVVPLSLLMFWANQPGWVTCPAGDPDICRSERMTTVPARAGIPAATRLTITRDRAAARLGTNRIMDDLRMRTRGPWVR